MRLTPMRFAVAWFLSVLAVGLSGCAGYSWRSGVPSEYRTVSVPVFRNESKVTEVGSVMTRQLLREFQREGTFSIRASGDAALEVQGIVKSATGGVSGYDRRSGSRTFSGQMDAVVSVSVIDKRKGSVLIDNRPYRPQASFTTNGDLDTALRDASGRLAEDLAAQVVDDVLNLRWDRVRSTGTNESEVQK